MKNSLILALTILLTFFFGLNKSFGESVSQVNEGPPEEEETVGMLATVNGEPVTLVDVLKVCGMQEARLPFMYQGYELQEQVRKLRKEALEEVIERRLVYNDFAGRGFKLPLEYMQNYLDKIAESYNVNDQKALKALVESKGQTYADFKEEAYRTAAIEALIFDKCYRDVFITPKQTYDYYKKHESKFVTPEKIKLQILQLQKNGMHKKELHSLTNTLKKTFKNADKKTFDDAVLMYSEGPEIQNGGNIGWIEKTKLRKDFMKPLRNAVEGDIIGPIISKDANYFLRVDEISARKVEKYKNAKESIMKKLGQEERKKEYDKYIKDLKEDAYIKYYIN